MGRPNSAYILCAVLMVIATDLQYIAVRYAINTLNLIWKHTDCKVLNVVPL